MIDNERRGYLTAFIDGDGTVSDPGKRHRRVRITNTEPSLIEACCAILKDIGVTPLIYEAQRRHKPVWDIYIQGPNNIRALIAQVPLRIRHKRQRLRVYAERLGVLQVEDLEFEDAKAARGYLAGLIDAEGTVNLHSRVVRITNTEPGALEDAGQCCKTLGIDSTLRSRKDLYNIRTQGLQVWDLYIAGRDNLERVASLPLQSRAKQERLRSALARYKPRRPNRDTLFALYLEQNLSAKKIAKLLHVAKGDTIQRWLRDAGVPLRTRSDAAKLQWVTRKRIA